MAFFNDQIFNHSVLLFFAVFEEKAALALFFARFGHTQSGVKEYQMGNKMFTFHNSRHF
jgi:hypothetical protein